MILGFTPAFVALVLFFGTVFDVPLRRALWLIAIVILPLVVVTALHLLENRHPAAWVPRQLSRLGPPFNPQGNGVRKC